MESYSIFLCYYFAFLEKQKIRPQYPSNNWLFPGKEPTVKCSSSKHTSPSKKTILFCYYITKIHHHKKRQIKNQATGNNFGPVCFRMGIIWKNLGTPDKTYIRIKTSKVVDSAGFGPWTREWKSMFWNHQIHLKFRGKLHSNFFHVEILVIFS